MSVHSASGERSAVERMSHLLEGFDHAIGISQHRVVIAPDAVRHLPHMYPRVDLLTPASTMGRFLDEEETRDGPAVALARIWGQSDVPASIPGSSRGREGAGGGGGGGGKVRPRGSLAHPSRETMPHGPYGFATSSTVGHPPPHPMASSMAHRRLIVPAAIPTAPKVVVPYLSPQPSLSELAYRKRIFRLVAARLLALGFNRYGFTALGVSVCTPDTVLGSYAGDFSTAASTPADLPPPQNTRKRGVAKNASDSSDETPIADLARKRSRAPIVPRMYACPYYRLNPDDVDFMPDGELKKCRTDGIKGGKIKEHVRRTHTKPAQCLNCGRRGDQGDIRAHMDRIRCAPNNAIVQVDAETLATETRLTVTRGAAWHVIFSILFPGAPVPPENAQYFVEAEIVVEHVDSRQERLAYVIAEHLDRSGIMLGELLNSPEYQQGLASSHHSPGTAMIVGAAARLMEIFSRIPFVESIAPDPPQQHAGEINFDWLDDIEVLALDHYSTMMFGPGGGGFVEAGV